MSDGNPQSTGSDAAASILVVDDHAELVLLLALLLTSDGYSVVGARSVAEALGQYVAAAPPWLVIADVCLEDGNGADLIARLGHPMARVLFTSGHARESFEGTSAAIPPEASFLQKPYPPAALLTAVRALRASDG